MLLMKKRFIILAALIIFVSIVALSPVAINRRLIRQQVDQQLTSLLGETARITGLEWRWLPMPALKIKNLTSTNDSYSITVPQVLLFPNWRSIFNRKFSLGKITCISPVVIIKNLQDHTKFTWPNHLPNLKVSVTNGTLVLPAVTDLPDGIRVKRLQFKKLRLDINSRGQRLKLHVRAKTNFSKEIDILAKLDMDKRSYILDLNGRGINPANLFGRLGAIIKPATGNFPVAIHLEGRGPDNWRMSINEIKTPCPIYLGSKLCTIKSLAALTLTKYNKIYLLKLNKLVLADPAMNLSGTVSLRHDIQGGKPQWVIDLNGRHIDLGAVRQVILQNFSGNSIAQKVCAIVRGGWAQSAHYTFRGTTADFKHIHKMKLWVDVKKAPIHIPEINLNLDWASGPITIINGNLAGRGLRAQIAKSHGEKGNLYMALTRKNHDFSLNLDINADLGDLKTVLTKIIDYRPLQSELHNFKSLRGRARGNLDIGDKLGSLQTYVRVDNIQGQGEYNRLPWAFKLTNGNLQISPQEIRWDHIKGTLGPQMIRRSAGNIVWGDGRQCALNITRLDARIDLGSLWRKGAVRLNNKWHHLKHYFGRQLSSISGQAELRHFTLHGPAASPSAWIFKGDMAIPKLKFSSTGLPGVVKSNGVQAHLTNKSAAITGIFSLAGQSLYLKGRYWHHNFHQWHGKSTFNGIISQKLGDWLKKQNVLPARLFPRLPCRLKNFTVTGNNSSWTDIRVQGGIIAGITGNSSPELDLDLIHTPALSISNLTLHDGPRKGTLTYITNSSQTIFTWHGILRAQALTPLLQQNIINSGSLNGSFNMLSSYRHGLSASFSGYLKGKDLTILPPDNTPKGQAVSIRNFDISGNKHKIKITRLDIRMGQNILHSHGQLTTGKNKYQLNMDAVANDIAWYNIKQTITTIREKLRLKPGGIRHILPKNLTGIISFDLGRFTYRRQQQKEPQTLYSWSPLLGTLTFGGNSHTKVKLNSGLICGMDMSGVWEPNGPPASSFFQIFQKKPKFFFENTLPCLGIKQGLIEGPFSLDVKLNGLPGAWQSGHLNLQSPHGLIRRMDLLSKIFSVINFTDLLSWHGKSASGHKGLRYNNLTVETTVKNNLMNVHKIVLKGKGVNLTGRGTIALQNRNADLTFFIAPLKMIDSVVTSIPLIGKTLGGKKESILTFPVAVKGPLKDPEVTALPPDAIGRATLEFVLDTLSLPFRIFKLFLPKTSSQPAAPNE